MYNSICLTPKLCRSFFFSFQSIRLRGRERDEEQRAMHPPCVERDLRPNYTGLCNTTFDMSLQPLQNEKKKLFKFISTFNLSNVKHPNYSFELSKLHFQSHTAWSSLSIIVSFNLDIFHHQFESMRKKNTREAFSISLKLVRDRKKKKKKRKMLMMQKPNRIHFQQNISQNIKMRRNNLKLGCWLVGWWLLY